MCDSAQSLKLTPVTIVAMNKPENRFSVLDGWRGIAILLVLAAHLFPIGPKFLHLNDLAGLVGMALFFVLSGFLMSHFLLYRTDVIDFLIRRFFRILPLAWLVIAISLLIFPVNQDAWLAHLFFYANYPPKPFVPHVTEHFWSLCVELHFYIGIALIVSLFKKNGLLLIPLICVGITLLRIIKGAEISVITHLRVDEILAGSMLALVFNQKLGLGSINFIRKQNFFLMLALLLISSHPQAGAFLYLRPYFAALLIGNTLLNQGTKINLLLDAKILVYIASISYALYVLHPLLASSWLGSGNIMEKYSKRPLLLIVIFVCAYLSTFYYEHKAIAIGKTLSLKINFFKQAKAVNKS